MEPKKIYIVDKKEVCGTSSKSYHKLAFRTSSQALHYVNSVMRTRGEDIIWEIDFDNTRYNEICYRGVGRADVLADPDDKLEQRDITITITVSCIMIHNNTERYC